MRRLAVIAGSIALVFHLIANPHYGFFRDELYFIICGFHPQWGYVDQPPVTPLLAAGSQLFGHSLFLLRAVAAIFGGASVYVICLLVIEFGGGRFALVLAAICGTLCPVLAAFAEKAGPDMVGLWLWPLAALYLVRMANGGDPRQWIGAGVAIGFSAESKYSVLYFAVAILLALLVSPQRRLLYSKWFAAGAALAIVIALPNFIWQAVNGFPMLELLRNGQMGKNVVLSPLEYVVAELLITNPLLALVWICGLIWTFASRQIRFLGYGYILLIIMMIGSHAKHYYPGDVYPIFFAAGGVAIEAWTQRARYLRPIFAAAGVLAGLILLPYVEPILPEQTFIAFNKAVGPKIGQGVLVTEHQKQNWMTQDWADMHGWPQLAATVQNVYDSLSPSDRTRAVAVAQNYGEASAIAFFSRVPVISGHNQYYLWGTGGYSGNVIIDVGGDCGASAHLFRESKRAATFTAPYIMPYEDGRPIMLCRGIKKPLNEIWPSVKAYE
ncbi:MAG TPA: glycosyltransferase family 39 protein [Candidatus Rubrimentiphilum sp.]|nr:glycosyltransferase family 39 protein [Candidatus Rubrimentiphilum sp.]